MKPIRTLTFCISNIKMYTSPSCTNPCSMLPLLPPLTLIFFTMPCKNYQNNIDRKRNRHKHALTLVQQHLTGSLLLLWHWYPLSPSRAVLSFLPEIPYPLCMLYRDFPPFPDDVRPLFYCFNIFLCCLTRIYFYLNDSHALSWFPCFPKWDSC